MIDSENVKNMHWTDLKRMYESLTQETRHELVGSDRNDELNHGLACRALEIVRIELARRGYRQDDL